MILTELKSYLKLNKKAVVKDMAYHFDTTPDAIKGMLEHWIRKGKVRRVEGSLCNKGCCKADPTHLEIYEWVELK
jgi:putative ferrous iron transport protein C